MAWWCEPRGALVAPGMLPAGMERKRHRHGTCLLPCGPKGAGGGLFRVFFGDNRNALPQELPHRRQQPKQAGEQTGPRASKCVSCPQTRRKNNHGCRLEKDFPKIKAPQRFTINKSPPEGRLVMFPAHQGMPHPPLASGAGGGLRPLRLPISTRESAELGAIRPCLASRAVVRVARAPGRDPGFA